MAALPINNSSAPNDLASLLAQLEPNALPPEPSIWPLAIGYWLIILSVIITIAAVVIYLIKTRLKRQIKQEINRILTLSNTTQQLIEAHHLIRWVLHKQLNMPVQLNHSDFACAIETRLGTLPGWINAHYRAEPSQSLNHNEFKKLVWLLIKEAK